MTKINQPLFETKGVVESNFGEVKREEVQIDGTEPNFRLSEYTSDHVVRARVVSELSEMSGAGNQVFSTNGEKPC